MGPRNHVLHGAQIPQEKGAILEVVRPIEKHCESVLRCTQQKNQ